MKKSAANVTFSHSNLFQLSVAEYICSGINEFSYVKILAQFLWIDVCLLNNFMEMVYYEDFLKMAQQ